MRQTTAVQPVALSQQARTRWRALLPPLLIVIAVALVFGQTVGFEFVAWDDGENITENPYLNPVSLRSVSRFWVEPYFFIYVPVTYTVWGLLAWISELLQPGGGPMPALFHLSNVLLHTVNALLVYRLLVFFMGPGWAACAGALLFALHPLQVENVAWVSGMMHLLAGSLSLTSLWLYLLHARRAQAVASLRSRRVPYWAALGLFLLALLAKPSAAALPLIAWVLDCLLIGRNWRAATRALAPWLLPAAAAAALLPLIDPQTLEVARTPLWLRPLVAGDAVAFYLGKLIVPARLGIDYARTPAALGRLTWFYVAWIVPVTLGWVLWRVRHRHRWLTAAGGVFLGGLLPMLGLVPVPFQVYSTVADRYMYQAMLGPSLALVGVLHRGRSRLRMPLVALVLLVLALQSSVQTMYWRNSLALLSHAIEVTPRSWVAHSNLGLELAHAGQVPLGLAHIRYAISLRPDAYKPRFNYAFALLLAGQKQEAVAQLRELVRYHPRVPEARDLLACALDETGQTAEALLQWREAVRLDPYYSRAWYNVGMSHYNHGRIEDALTAWRAALCGNPNFQPALTELQRVLRAHPELRTPTDPPAD